MCIHSDYIRITVGLHSDSDIFDIVDLAKAVPGKISGMSPPQHILAVLQRTAKGTYCTVDLRFKTGRASMVCRMRRTTLAR